MEQSRQVGPVQEPGVGPRYCGVCGAIFTDREVACPRCETPWKPPASLDPATLATLLTDLPRLRDLGLIDEKSAGGLRATYEHWLTLLRPAASERLAEARAAMATPARRDGDRASAQPSARLVLPQREPGPSLAQWTAARQADILLYLGAFLLSIAALIFVGYQGQALGGGQRFAVLLGYTVAFPTLGFILPRWPRVREAGAVFLGLGALLVPVNFLALRMQVLGGSVPASTIWLVGGAATAALYGALTWRGLGRLYLVGAAVASLVAWGALGAVLALPVAWFGAWYAGAAAALIGISASLESPARGWTNTLAGLISASALLYAHGAALIANAGAAQLPAAYGVILAGVLSHIARRRDRSILLVPVLSVVTTSSLLWVLGVAAAWWAYPGSAAAVVLLGADLGWNRAGAKAGEYRLYLLGLAIVPPVVLSLAGVYNTLPLHGLLVYLLTAAIVLAVSLRARGDLARLLLAEASGREERAERLVLAGAAIACLLAAASYFNRWAAVQGSEQAWAYAILGLTAWLGLGIAGGSEPDLLALLAPAGTVAMGIAATLAAGSPGTATLVLALAGVGPAVALPATRRWSLWIVVAAFTAGAIGFAWEWSGRDSALLALAYAAVAAALWGGLIAVRRYAPRERDIVVAVLSWAPWGIALTTAYTLLVQRAGSLLVGQKLVRTDEWTVLILVVAATAAALLVEGIRLRRQAVWIAGGAGLLIAALLGIAVAQPANLQAYTAPIGLYLVALGLLRERSPQVLGEHMSLHEGVIVLGLLFLVLPPAAQSFGADGNRYLFELVAEALTFLALGFALSIRWLTAGGVLTFTAIAVRGLTECCAQAPYWLVLGVAGMALLGVGVLLLLQRERWDRARQRISRWWLRAPLERYVP